ncbi:uncharacterized protein LOC129286510 [Prosopis cineraria]|uniref:uncharacterized protein LOC129286510 n=1 Tax=Prosopis cineraria TaxID=364024 RepID=UPI002410A21C|nr:uncharacterized protein LOC129286510 [Prosopis cineraria]
MIGSSSSEQQENHGESLCIALMREDWTTVLQIFENQPQIQDRKMGDMMKATNEIRGSRHDDESWSDTALHWAIANGAPEDEVVEKLVSEIEKTGKALETLKAKNSRGDTPLHCAASRGSDTICRRITRVHESLVCERNNEEETPLFLAALNGHQSAFDHLHSICLKVELSLPPEIWTRKNGDTILHCTIRRKHFGQHI